MIIGNPSGAFQTISTFVSGVADDGTTIQYGDGIRNVYRANAAIAKGEAVEWVNPTATVPLSVKKMVTTSDPRNFAGIAEQAATAAGAYIRICEFGHTLVYANAQTVAAGDVVKVPGTNDGEASFSSTDPDATAIVGTIIGRAHGIKNATTNLAPVTVRHM